MKWIIIVAVFTCGAVVGQEENDVPIYYPLKLLFVPEARFNPSPAYPSTSSLIHYIPNKPVYSFGRNSDGSGGWTPRSYSLAGSGNKIWGYTLNYQDMQFPAGASDFTLSVWVKDNTASNSGCCYFVNGEYNPVGSEGYISFGKSGGGTVYSAIDRGLDGNGDYFSFSSALSSASRSNWTHWVVVHDAATRASYGYCNGKIITSGSSTSGALKPYCVPTSTRKTFIGCQTVSASPYWGSAAAYFSGEMGMIEIVGRKLSQVEVMTLYNYGIGRYIK
jgi:hypothetical protein